MKNAAIKTINEASNTLFKNAFTNLCLSSSQKNKLGLPGTINDVLETLLNFYSSKLPPVIY